MVSNNAVFVELSLYYYDCGECSGMVVIFVFNNPKVIDNHQE